MRTSRIMALVLLAVLLGTVSCRGDLCQALTSDADPATTRAISRSEAESNAVEFLKLDYPLKEYEAFSEEVEEVWKVTFKPRAGDARTAFGPIAFVSRKSGKVVFVEHSK